MIRARPKSPLRLAPLAAALAMLHAAPAAAAPVKVWVAYYGVDSTACGAISTPCLGLQQAHDNVAPGGDVGFLTPLDFGLKLTISKSVNITNDSVGEASILVTAGNPSREAIHIGASTGDVVSLRGLVLDGLVVNGNIGVSIVRASAVHIQNCVIRNFEGIGLGWGILFGPGLDSGQLFVSDTIIYNNAVAGILVQPSLGSAKVVLDRVHLENNVVGLRVDGRIAPGPGSRVILRNSVVAGNAGDGIHVVTEAGEAPSFVAVHRTTLLHNAGTGIHADGPRAVVLINDDTISQNGTGIGATNGGQLFSYGNNRNNNNIGAEGAPTGMFVPM